MIYKTLNTEICRNLWQRRAKYGVGEYWGKHSTYCQGILQSYNNWQCPIVEIYTKRSGYKVEIHTHAHSTTHKIIELEQSCHCRIIPKMIFLINDAGSTRHLFGVNYYRWIIKQNMSYKTIKLLYSKIKINYLLHIKLQPKHEIKTNEAHKNSWSSWIQYRWQRFHK